MRVTPARLTCASLAIVLVGLLPACSAALRSASERSESGQAASDVDERYSIAYARPPAVGSMLNAQLRLVHCPSIATARYMAETGFFAPGCEPVRTDGRFEVLARRHVQVSGGGLWLIETRDRSSSPSNHPSSEPPRDRAVSETSAIRWVPVPWHDWI